MSRGRVIFENEGKVALVYPSDKLKHLIAYYFEINVPQTASTPLEITALPSLHMVASFSLSSGDDKLCGCLSRALELTFMPGHHEFAVKFQPGVVSLFSESANTLLDSSICLTEILESEEIQSIKQKRTFLQRIACFEKYFLHQEKKISSSYAFEIVAKVIDFVEKNKEYKLKNVCTLFSISPATLNRYFLLVFGMTPKQCFQIIRFRDALRLYRSQKSLQAIEGSGYTDYSHFIKEAKLLTKAKPSEL